MRLHEFMNQHRDEILDACYDALESQEHGDETSEHLQRFFDELLHAMQRDSGIPEARSPLPDSSDTAARIGLEYQRAGLPAARVPLLFGAISQALAKTGALYELVIAAEDYKLLNHCLDVGVATSIENYWQRERSQVAQRTTEVYGHLAHELRNALGNAMMAFKLMRGGNLDSNGRTASVLSRNLHRMGMLIAHVLGSAQIDGGGRTKLAPVQVAEVLRDVEAAALPDRGVRVVLEVDELLYVLADELSLSSAVGNLVHNAVKFSPEGGTVRLSADAAADQVTIRVEDECGGLNPDTSLDDLCKPYVSLRTGSTRGVGLGLAITKAAVSQLGGELSLSSRPGVGCTFMVHLPLVKLP